MKKITLLLIMGLSTQMNYAQSNNINVTVQRPNPIGDAMDKVMQANVANITARANEAEAQASNNAVFNETIKNNYSKVTIDNLINNTNNYEYIVIENVGGWAPKENTEDLINILSGAKKYTIINISKYYNTHKKNPSNLINNKEVLFLNWLRDAQGDVNRITQLSVKNSEGKLIYESTSKNLSHAEILKPLISNYIFTKEQALSKIEDLKKYLDLGVITKEEYDSKISELKPILLGNN
ncbi:hypothetical protein [Flavobacterium sp. ZB4R12]|uniref:hypothetical protein n=1 Tax=Flavobacterium sp. ZB4R12 TaxID=3398732 RepID=UPI003AAABD95